MNLTRQQRVSLKRVYDRDPMPCTYREFRRTVQPYIGGACVMVRWAGMWLGIETDGHTHS